MVVSAAASSNNKSRRTGKKINNTSIFFTKIKFVVWYFQVWNWLIVFRYHRIKSLEKVRPMKFFSALFLMIHWQQNWQKMWTMTLAEKRHWRTLHAYRNSNLFFLKTKTFLCTPSPCFSTDTSNDNILICNYSQLAYSFKASWDKDFACTAHTRIHKMVN